MATTQVADTIYHAGWNGRPSGTVLISWPAFTTSNGDSIPSGSTSAVIAAGGALSVQLVPNYWFNADWKLLYSGLSSGRWQCEPGVLGSTSEHQRQ